MAVRAPRRGNPTKHPRHTITVTRTWGDPGAVIGNRADRDDVEHGDPSPTSPRSQRSMTDLVLFEEEPIPAAAQSSRAEASARADQIRL